MHLQSNTLCIKLRSPIFCCQFKSLCCRTLLTFHFKLQWTANRPLLYRYWLEACQRSDWSVTVCASNCSHLYWSSTFRCTLPSTLHKHSAKQTAQVHCTMHFTLHFNAHNNTLHWTRVHCVYWLHPAPHVALPQRLHCTVWRWTGVLLW